MLWISFVIAYIVLGTVGAFLMQSNSSKYTVQLVSTFFAIWLVQSLRGYFYPFLMDAVQDYYMMIFLTLIVSAVICGFTLILAWALLLIFKQKI
jgi:hypothetical protein